MIETVSWTLLKTIYLRLPNSLNTFKGVDSSLSYLKTRSLKGSTNLGFGSEKDDEFSEFILDDFSS